MPRRNVWFNDETNDLIDEHPEWNLSAICASAVRVRANMPVSVDTSWRTELQQAEGELHQALIQIDEGQRAAKRAQQKMLRILNELYRAEK